MHASPRRILSFLAVSLFAIWLSGCTARVYRGSSSYAYSDPSLVVVSPGVQVVADYPSTVYYTGGYYWYYESGGWYRSARWNGSRVRVSARAVPGSIRTRDHARYVRYRAGARAQRRDTRAQRRDTRRDNRVQRRDTRRDNRADRRDNRRERRVERKADRVERRQQRHDTRQDTRQQRRDSRTQRRDKRQDKRSDKRRDRRR